MSERVTSYSNRYRQLSYDSDPNYGELDGCNSGNSVYHFGIFSGYRALPFFILRPKLKIEDCVVRTQNCFFYIHNVGKRTANGVRIKFKANVRMPKRTGAFKRALAFNTLNPDSPNKLEPFDIDPDETMSVKICELTKDDKRVIFPCVQDEQALRMPSFSLEWGHKHDLLFRFVGRNFSDRKMWHLFLDLRHEKPQFTLVSRNIFSQYLSDHLRDTG